MATNKKMIVTLRRKLRLMISTPEKGFHSLMLQICAVVAGNQGDLIVAA